MQNSFRFETPENVQVQYEPAGLGTRFLAWVVDQIVLWLAMIALFVVLMLVTYVPAISLWLPNLLLK